MKEIILASSSPRRKVLLEKYGISYLAVSPGYNEKNEPRGEDLPENQAKEHAIGKAASIREKYPHKIILGADTLVAKNRRVFGKPVDFQDACRMLKELSGGTHRVVTGCAIIIPDKEPRIFTETTFVEFRTISVSEIEYYVRTGEPMDKAGAYAYQGGAKKWVIKTEGSTDNIIGLPMEKIITILDLGKTA